MQNPLKRECYGCRMMCLTCNNLRVRYCTLCGQKFCLDHSDGCTDIQVSHLISLKAVKCILSLYGHPLVRLQVLCLSIEALASQLSFHSIPGSDALIVRSVLNSHLKV